LFAFYLQGISELTATDWFWICFVNTWFASNGGGGSSSNAFNQKVDIYVLNVLLFDI